MHVGSMKNEKLFESRETLLNVFQAENVGLKLINIHLYIDYTEL